MKTTVTPSASRGFSLVELLTAVAVISTLAAMVLFNLSHLKGDSELVKTRQNAKSLCSLYQAARSAGVHFQSTTKEGILEELISGKEGSGSLSGTRFQLPLAAREKSPTLALCHYDAASDMLVMR